MQRFGDFRAVRLHRTSRIALIGANGARVINLLRVVIV